MGSWDKIKSIDFHDNGISSLNYNFEESQLSLVIELGDWMQELFWANHPKIERLTIMFTNVRSFSLIGLGDRLLEHDEISDVEITPAGSLSNLDLVRVKFILLAPHLHADIALLEVVASNIEMFGADNKPI